MRFCTSCGREVIHGQKFCEYCGTRLEQPAAAPAAPAPPRPAVPAAPVQPQAAPTTSSGGSGKIKVIAGIIVVVMIIAGIYFIGLPIIIESSGNGSTLQQATTLPTQVLTPFPTPPHMEITGTPLTAEIPAVILTYEERYMEIYNQVLSVNRASTGGQKAVFTQDLTPPSSFYQG